MNIVLCIDDRNGMAFRHRRQSRDRTLARDLMELSGGYSLYMNKYSDKMFSDWGYTGQIAEDDFLTSAGSDDFCFVENTDISDQIDRIQKIIIYRWNRRYPADLYFDPSVLDGFERREIREFQGSSHDKITREVYSR